MKRLALKDWAAIAEIVGTIAVVISLVFVIRSVNRNTAELRTANDAFMYELADSQLGSIAADPDLAVRYARAGYGLDFSDSTEAQMFWTKMRDMNMWEASYYWHADGFFSDRQWAGWNESFSSTVRNEFPETWWQSVRINYAEDFSKHVDEAYGEE